MTLLQILRQCLQQTHRLKSQLHKLLKNTGAQAAPVFLYTPNGS